MLYTAISLQLRSFSKIATIVHQKDSRSFKQWVQQEANETFSKITREQTHTHTHTHTDCHHPPPMLGLNICTET